MTSTRGRETHAPVVLCLSPSFGTTSNQPAAEIESAGATLIIAAGPNSEQAIGKTLPTASALIVGTQKIDAQILAAGQGLVIVAKHGAGLDNIDVGTASELGIAVTGAPGTNAGAVAELAMGLMLALARGIVGQDALVRAGTWSVATGKALEGATLGIVGMGRIGRLVARRAAAFEMRILAYDVLLDEAAPGEPWTNTDLDTLLRESDFITVHVPLTADTDGLIDDRALGLMKPSAFLVNTSRGRIVDERALNEALSDGRIAGAALDVFSEEPLPSSNPLILQHDRTILTPHMGAYTDRALTETSLVTARNVVAALAGTWPPDAVNLPTSWRGGQMPAAMSGQQP